MTAERFQWIGLGAIIVSVGAFVYHLFNVIRGKEPKSIMIDESMQDIGLACLGGSLMMDKGTTGRIVLMAAFVVVFGSFVAKRIWTRRGELPSRREK